MLSHDLHACLHLILARLLPLLDLIGDLFEEIGVRFDHLHDLLLLFLGHSLELGAHHLLQHEVLEHSHRCVVYPKPLEMCSIL